MKWTISTILRATAWSLIAAANVGVYIYNYTEPDTTLLLRVWRNNQIEDFTGGWHSIDSHVLRAPGTENVALIFLNFDSNDSLCKNMAQEISHRGAYTLYPRKLIVATDGTILGGGLEILKGQFNPDAEYLRDRNVRYAIVCNRENGVFSVMVVDVPPPVSLPPVLGGR